MPSQNFFSPGHATATARRLRTAVAAREITPYDFVIADHLLWQCRKLGRADARISMSALASRCGRAKSTVEKTVKRLADLGLFRVVKSRLRVWWGVNHSSVASRQDVNTYVFCAPDTETARRPVERVKDKTLESQHARPLGKELAAALESYQTTVVKMQGARNRENTGTAVPKGGCW
jgi:hypothetical protein